MNWPTIIAGLVLVELGGWVVLFALPRGATTDERIVNANFAMAFANIVLAMLILTATIVLQLK